jgi:hypothetical protein
MDAQKVKGWRQWEFWSNLRISAGIFNTLGDEAEEHLEGPWPVSGLVPRTDAALRRELVSLLSAGPAVRKRPLAFDEVFYPVPFAGHSPATEPSLLGDTSILYRPHTKRQFRPPRPAPC